MNSSWDMQGAFSTNSTAKPRVVILEQPATHGKKFRYESEGPLAGSISGASSTTKTKTFPKIRIEGYNGKAIVVVSCVTKDEPYRPHPHKLVGRDGCKDGICVLDIPTDTMTIEFTGLGIQCVKRKDIKGSLELRQRRAIDPFDTGFSHCNNPSSIDLSVLRLCFQVLLKTTTVVPLDPVVSTPIFDKKFISDLVIHKLSDCSCGADGGSKDIILLCEKVTKGDVEIYFYEERDGEIVWSGRGEFQESHIHKQVAISFRPPAYGNLEITEPVEVHVQLKRPSNGDGSEPLKFIYYPLYTYAQQKIDNLKEKFNYVDWYAMNTADLLAKESDYKNVKSSDGRFKEPSQQHKEFEYPNFYVQPGDTSNASYTDQRTTNYLQTRDTSPRRHSPSDPYFDNRTSYLQVRANSPFTNSSNDAFENISKFLQLQNNSSGSSSNNTYSNTNNLNFLRDNSPSRSSTADTFVDQIVPDYLKSLEAGSILDQYTTNTSDTSSSRNTYTEETPKSVYPYEQALNDSGNASVPMFISGELPKDTLNSFEIVSSLLHFDDDKPLTSTDLAAINEFHVSDLNNQFDSAMSISEECK